MSPKQPARRRAREYPIDRETPRALDLHLIADNYATHKKVQTWLTQHPCFPMHFTPTSSSWLNLVERFFADLTLCVRIGNFASVNELVRDIKSDLAEYNADRARAMALTPKSSSRNLWRRLMRGTFGRFSTRRRRIAAPTSASTRTTGFFPSDDTMPAGGFGNLIALPLQNRPNENGSSVSMTSSARVQQRLVLPAP